MTQRPELMIVGPGPLHDEDLEVMGEQLIAHYGDAWVALHNETIGLLGTLLNASDPPYLIPGSGTLCLDAALMNLFEPGARVTIPNTGFFGARLIEVARANRLEIHEVPIEIGKPAVPEALIAEDTQAVILTHVETSTGVRHPIKEIAKAAKQKGMLTIVDGIASVGGELCDVDGWGIDVLITATQKGMEGPPGLGVVALGKRARERLEARTEPVGSWYMDLKRWDWYRKEWPHHPHPVTFPTSLTLALRSSVQRILNVGLEKWVEQRAQLAATLREGLIDQGFEMVAAAGTESNMVVAAYADDATALVGSLLKQGIQISGGLAPLVGKTFRIGLMGASANLGMVQRVLDAIARARKEQ